MAALLDCLFHWSMPADSMMELASADVIATHEFGDQQVPSASTAAIVRRAVELSKRFGKPLICQFPGNEVAEAEGVLPVEVIRQHLRKPGQYLDTEEVNRQIALLCSSHGWKRVILCTHPHHVWRAGQNLQKHGLTPLYPDMRDIPYDPNCSRRALRTPWLFIPREVLARVLYLRRGYI